MAKGRSGETETLGGIREATRFRDRGNEPEMPQIERAIAKEVAGHIELNSTKCSSLFISFI
jgi:hypothetical protein